MTVVMTRKQTEGKEGVGRRGKRKVSRKREKGRERERERETRMGVEVSLAAFCSVPRTKSNAQTKIYKNDRVYNAAQKFI